MRAGAAGGGPRCLFLLFTEGGFGSARAAGPRGSKAGEAEGGMGCALEEAEEAGKGEEKKEEQSADKNEGKDSGLGWQATAVIVGALVVAGAAYLVKRAYKK